MLESFQEGVLSQLFGVLLIGDHADYQGKHLLSVCLDEMLVERGLSSQDALDDMSFVVSHFVLLDAVFFEWLQNRHKFFEGGNDRCVYLIYKDLK